MSYQISAEEKLRANEKIAELRVALDDLSDVVNRTTPQSVIMLNQIARVQRLAGDLVLTLAVDTAD